MINSNTRVLIANAKDPERKAWLVLPFLEYEFDELLESIGVDVDEDEETDTYDLLMSGEDVNKWIIVAHESDFLRDEHFNNLGEANDLTYNLENLEEYDAELVEALIEDGDTLEEAVDNAERGYATFYSNTTLESLAEEFVEEGLFDQSFLMKYIDYRALGESLSEDGYVEVNGGVLRRD